MRRPAGLPLLGLLMAVVALPRSAAGAPILIESHLAADDGFAGPAIVSAQSVSQTWKAGGSGLLAQIDLGLYRSDGATGDVLFDILPAAGFPSLDFAASLLSTAIPIASIPLFAPHAVPLTSLDVLGAGIEVERGERLAIALRRQGGSFPPWVIWQHTPAFENGAMHLDLGESGVWTPTVFDVTFQVWLERTGRVPEPAAAALLVVGLAAVRAVRRRSSRTHSFPS